MHLLTSSCGAPTSVTLMLYFLKFDVLEIPKAIISPAIVNFLQSNAWDQHVDLRLEHAFNVELSISAFVTKLEESVSSSSS